MTTFKELVEAYSQRLQNMIVIKAKHAHQVDSEDNVAAMVLLHKLEKHYKENNSRSCATYLAMWIREDLGPLPDRAKDIAIKLNLKAVKLKDGEYSVGYLHEDGTYHYM